MEDSHSTLIDGPGASRLNVSTFRREASLRDFQKPNPLLWTSHRATLPHRQGPKAHPPNRVGIEHDMTNQARLA